MKTWIRVLKLDHLQLNNLKILRCLKCVNEIAILEKVRKGIKKNLIKSMKNSCKSARLGLVVKMKINIKGQETKDLKINSSSVKEVLHELEINSTEVVVKKDGIIIHEDQLLTNEDEITVIKVVFGG